MALYKSPRTVCCVFDCHSRITLKNKAEFFKFPSKVGDGNLLMQWVDAVKIPKKLTRDMTVCHRHFKSTDFVHAVSGQRKLKPNAVPSQLLPKVWRNKFHPRDYGRMVKHMEVRGIGRLRMCFEAKLGRRLRKAHEGQKGQLTSKPTVAKKQESIKPSLGSEADEVTLVPAENDSTPKKLPVPAPLPPSSNDPFTSEIEIKEEPLSETEETIEDLLARMNGQPVEPKDKGRTKESQFELKNVCNDCGSHVPCKCNPQLSNRGKLLQKLGEISCSTCMIGFASMEKLKEHNQALHEEQSFLCILCNEHFKLKSGLMEHVAKHAVIHNFKCKVCTQYFSSKEDRDKHFRGHRIVKREYTCRECKVVLKTRAACWDHLNVHLRGRLKSLTGVPCEVCGRVLSTRITLKEHKLIHSGEKPFECQLCGRKIRHRSNFLLHVQGHTLGLPFQCTLCGMSFHKKSELNTHISVEHSDQKDYNCSICGIKFKTESRFIKHAMTHNAALDE